MGIDRSILSEFIKATNDKKESKQAQLYGTVVTKGNSKCVKIDGSEIITPVRSTTDIKDDERVMVTIKDHMATITGNMSNPSVGNDRVELAEGKIDRFDHLFAGNITAVNIAANSITSDKILAGSITTDKLMAECIISDKIAADTIESKHIKADVIESEHIKADSIEAEHIRAGIIESDHISSGTITADKIATGTITAGSGVIADGAIGNAQISKIDAAKIEAGTIDTSKVTVQGSNGHLRLKDNRLQVFDGIGNKAKERVSVGDVNGDGSQFGLRVRGADGETILLDEHGVTREGITDGSITNDKISSDANIDGAKLNINSVISKINEDGTETIQGAKIEVDGTTLETKLYDIKMKQDENTDSISQAQSQITANTNAIKLKVDEQTYTTDKKDMTSKLEKNTSEISAMKGQIALKVEHTDIENAKSELKDVMDSKINTAKSEIKVTTDAISQNVSQLSNTVSNKADGSTVTSINNKVGSLETSVNGISGKVANLETTTTNLGTSVEGVQGEISTLKSDVASLEVTTGGISQKVSSVESTTATLTNKVTTAQNTADSANNKIDGLQVGGRNLFLNSNFINNNNWNGLPTINKDGNINYIRSSATFITYQKVNVKKGSTYVFSALVRAVNTTPTNFSIKFDTANHNSTSVNVTSTEWTRVSVEIVAKSTLKELIYLCNRGNAGIDIALVKMEEGNKATDWTPAPEDVDNAISTVESKVETTNNKVAEITTNLDSITQRVQSTESTTTTLTTQMSQVDGKINTAKSEAITDARTIPDTRNTNENPQWYITNYPRQTITEFKYANVIGISSSSGYGTLETKVPWANSSGGYPVQTFRSNSTATYERKGTSTTAWSTWKQVEDTSGSQAKATQALTDAKEFTTTEVTKTNNKVATIETNLGSITSRVSNVENTTTTINGNITNLQSRMNSAEQKITDSAIISTVTSSSTYKNAMTGKVDKTQIISTINQTAESIKINANKIQLTGQVVCDAINSGSTTINGSKITTGSISADKINVTNLAVKGELLTGVINGVNGIYLGTGASMFGAMLGYKDKAMTGGKKWEISSDGWCHFTSGGEFNGDVNIIGQLTVKGNITGTGNLTLDQTLFVNTVNNNLYKWRVSSDGWGYFKGGAQFDNTTVINGTLTCNDFRVSGSVNTSANNWRVASSGWAYFKAGGQFDANVTVNGRITGGSFYTTGGTQVGSDARLKENIQYINSNIELYDSRISIEDMYKFIKDLPLTKYDLIEGVGTNEIPHYGFIIQDIYDTKVGKELVYIPSDENKYMSYSEQNLITFIIGALQEEIKQREELEEKIKNLTEESKYEIRCK